MSLLLDMDLDWLCLSAEVAAGLLILSFAWRPSGRATDSSEVQVASTIDWEPLQDAHVLAVTGTGRSLSLRPNPMDEQRLRKLQASLPSPYKDRLTGTWNAHGMDRLIGEWSCEPDLGAYPSCYAVLTLSGADQMLEQHGAACIEQAMIRLSELLNESIGCCACISRYQPHRFLIHHFGKSLSECQDSLSIIREQVAAPEYFTFHEETIPLRCETHCWSFDRSIDPEALLQLLAELGEEEISSAEDETSPEEANAAQGGFAPEPKKAFSLDDLAPFPCPWDSPSDEPSESGDVSDDPQRISEETEPNDASAPMVSEDRQQEPSQSLEGVASSGQIDELLAQLSTDATAAPVTDKAFPAEDTEESNLKEDLDSLFATVRSSAVDDRGYQEEPKLDR